MSKRILILCDAITPPLYSPRVINLCKNLNQAEWNPYIFTEQMYGINYNTDVCPLYQMKYYKHNNKIYWSYKYLLNLFFQNKDIRLKKFIEKNIDVTTFDLILCSSFNLFPLTTAYNLSKTYKIPLICDLRDINEQWGKTIYSNHKFRINILNRYLQNIIDIITKKRRNKVLRAANAITTISPWHKSFLEQFNRNTYLIYNGYDEKTFFYKPFESQFFNITYTGKLYDLTFRNPNLLFEAVRDLIKQNEIDGSKLKINWYIGDGNREDLKKLIRKYDIEKYNNIFDFVPNNKIPDILNEASINLILTTKSSKDGTHGIMTTKFFEALGVEKPILCVRSDEECLARVISDTHCGLAATTVSQVREFILRYYQQWQQQGYTHLRADGHEQFTRRHQAQQFLSIFRSLTDSGTTPTDQPHQQ